jgi:hypothetical protein
VRSLISRAGCARCNNCGGVHALSVILSPPQRRATGTENRTHRNECDKVVVTEPACSQEQIVPKRVGVHFAGLSQAVDLWWRELDEQKVIKKSGTCPDPLTRPSRLLAISCCRPRLTALVGPAVRSESETYRKGAKTRSNALSTLERGPTAGLGNWRRSCGE